MKTLDYAALIRSMLSGMSVSLAIFGLTLLIALPLGLLIAAGRISKRTVINAPIRAFLLIMRGTPLMLQLFFFYFGPYYIFGIRGSDRFTMAIAAFALNYSAYFAEIYRGGIESIGAGQYEAAAALGFTRRQTFFKIIFPQVVKRITPPMGNEFMTLVKDTALARVIAVAEMFDAAAKAANGAVSVIPFVMAGVFYLIMNSVVENGFRVAERRLAYYK
ncbi:MAG: amino acid ABC transporter permease [Oscillospiraceae bacterium]|jgi:polar amino acid transport system permease protein|nr:amino acid ABC transporter permease [Oscillospiraceae bacterium]